MDPSTEVYFRYANYQRLNFKKRITTLLRYVEVVTLTAIAFWSSARIPAAASILVRHVIPVLVGPHFLFLMANAIVLSLLLLKPKPTAQSDKIRTNSNIADQISSSLVPPPPSAEEVAFEDKRVCAEVTAAAEAAHHQHHRHVRRTCRRSGSERIDVLGEEDRRRKRRSSSTELLRRAETDVGKMELKDEEEFRRMVEAFIEKQWKLQREESMAIVCSEDIGGEGLIINGEEIE